ncbi:hypothetical protein D3C71_1842250 [compost metagenome]
MLRSDADAVRQAAAPQRRSRPKRTPEAVVGRRLHLLLPIIGEVIVEASIPVLRPEEKRGVDIG